MNVDMDGTMVALLVKEIEVIFIFSSLSPKFPVFFVHVESLGLFLCGLQPFFHISKLESHFNFIHQLQLYKLEC